MNDPEHSGRAGPKDQRRASVVAQPTTPVPDAVPDTGLSVRQYYVMIGLGAFITTLCQPGVIGRLPLRLFLKDQLHLSAQAVATFTFVTTFAWNVKPVAGVYVALNGAWQADGASGPDILLITNCMREKTGRTIYIK